MNDIYKKLEGYNINSAIEYENNDSQYIALKWLWNSIEIKDKTSYLSFIIANAIICYQLSGKGEDYWKEFSENLLDYLNSGKQDLVKFFSDFLPKSKNNKRFVNIKLKRIKKLLGFLNKFKDNELFYYEDMNNMVLELSKIMKQKSNAKTIVFAVKMFSYGARNCFGKIVLFPKEICIPIDSRLTKIFEKYGKKNEKIENFYLQISNKLGIPELHLDAIIWNNKDLY